MKQSKNHESLQHNKRGLYRLDEHVLEQYEEHVRDIVVELQPPKLPSYCTRPEGPDADSTSGSTLSLKMPAPERPAEGLGPYYLAQLAPNWVVNGLAGMNTCIDLSCAPFVRWSLTKTC